MTPKEFERMQRLNMLKSLCFEDHALYSWTFDKDNGKNPIMWMARDYVDKWSDALSDNTGLVLWGDVGTGKTFFAACIANALVEQNVSVKMTNFSTILNDLFTESDKNKYLNRLNDHSLLIIDDLGIERGTEYALEQVYNVIDTRYKSGKPLIVTTNLTLDELKTQIEKDLQAKQIYFYSHCVGSAVALKTLNILDKNGKCKIKHYIAGASIPAEKPVKWNSWNTTPDFILRNILINAGAPISELSKAELKLMMKSFRNDTDFATQYFYKENERISCPISLVINKNDPFTTQYAKAEFLWRRYSDNVSEPYYINPTSHYFHSDNSEELIKIILEIMG